MKKQHKEENNISKLINNYIMNENWDKAKKIIESELIKTPDNHWLLIQLSEVYYEKHNYKKALELSTQAMALAPNCPLVNNDYALHLYMHELDDKAIEIWTNLLTKNINEIAEGECGEGIRNTKSMINDIRARIGKSYIEKKDFEKALFFFNEHLKNRQRGIYSNFTKKEIEKLVTRVSGQ